MKTLIVALISVGLSVGAAFGQKVHIDYDRDYDRTTVKTFAWHASPETDAPGLMHSRIVTAIGAALREGGLVEVEADPDVRVTYHTDTGKQLEIDTTDWGYRHGRRMHWSPYWRDATTTVREYTTGTLVVDVWDAETNALIWRGTASGLVPASPKKRDKKIEAAIGKMVKKWQKIRTKET